jgi:hypothetical protein
MAQRPILFIFRIFSVISVPVREQCPCFQGSRHPRESGGPGDQQNRASHLDSRFRGNDGGEQNQSIPDKSFSDGHSASAGAT